MVRRAGDHRIDGVLNTRRRPNGGCERQLSDECGRAPVKEPVVAEAVQLGGGDGRQPVRRTVHSHPAARLDGRCSAAEQQRYRRGLMLASQVGGEPVVGHPDGDRSGRLGQGCGALGVEGGVCDGPDRSEYLVVRAQRDHRARADVGEGRGQEEGFGLGQHPLDDAEPAHLLAERLGHLVTENRRRAGRVRLPLPCGVGEQPRLVVFDGDRRVKDVGERIGGREQVADHLRAGHRVSSGGRYRARQRCRDGIHARPAAAARYDKERDAGAERLGQQWLSQRAVVAQDQRSWAGRRQPEGERRRRAHADREHQVTGLESGYLQRVVNDHGGELDGEADRGDRSTDQVGAEAGH